MLIKGLAYYFRLSYWGTIYLDFLDTIPGFFLFVFLRSAISPSLVLDADLYGSLWPCWLVYLIVHTISSLSENIAVLTVFGLNSFGLKDVPFAHVLF